jgi:Tfp pilus assembly protein PilN
MTKSPNLIPMHRQVRVSRANRLRAWAYGGGALLAILAIAWFGCEMAWSQVLAPPPDAFAKATTEISRANEESASLRRQLASLREQVAARQSLTDRPDVSVLLAVLSQATADGVVLSHCELTYRDPRAAEPPQLLKMAGAARNQPAVAAFMLTLEGTGLFKNVTLVRSNQQQLMNTQVAGFQVECLIGPGQGGAK